MRRPENNRTARLGDKQPLHSRTARNNLPRGS